MKALSLLILLLSAPFLSAAQDPVPASLSRPTCSAGMNAVISAALRGNTQLAALRAKTQLDALEARSDNSLPDPEVELGRHWGSAAEMKVRHVVGVSQTIDWGVISGRRAHAADAAADVALAEYEAAAREVVLETERTLVRLIHAGRYSAEMRRRLSAAERLSELYASRLRNGDVSRMEASKTRLSAAAARADFERAEAERTALVAALARLCGTEQVAFDETEYPACELPPLADVMARAERERPELRAAQAAIESERRNLRRDRAEALPNLTVGYSGELIPGSSYNGVNIGFSLPLWGNSRRKVKRASAAVTLSELNAADALHTLRSTLSEQYATASRLQQSADRLRADIAETGNAETLTRALELGQISLTEYLQELTFYYSARESLLLAERDSRLALIELF